MARKKLCECHSCGKKFYLEDAIKLDDEEYPIYWCSDACRVVTSDKEIMIEKLNFIFKEILAVKTLNKSVKGYIRNRINEDFENKTEILLEVLIKKKEKISSLIKEKTFSNTTIKAKYIFACVKKDVDNMYKTLKEDITVEDLPTPLIKRVTKYVRDISKWL